MRESTFPPAVATLPFPPAVELSLIGHSPPPHKKSSSIFEKKNGNFETPNPASLLNRYFVVINYHSRSDLACFGMPNRNCRRTEVTFELNYQDLA